MDNFVNGWVALSSQSTITGQILYSMKALGDMAKALAELLSLV
ncbi:hypothetical protein V6D40_05535 [Corynebacterium sp. Q4381]